MEPVRNAAGAAAAPGTGGRSLQPLPPRVAHLDHLETSDAAARRRRSLRGRVFRYADPAGRRVAARTTAVDHLEQIFRGERLGQHRAHAQPLRGRDNLSRVDVGREDDEARPPLRAMTLDVLEEEKLCVTCLNGDGRADDDAGEILALHRRDRFVAGFYRRDLVPGATQGYPEQFPDGLVRLDDENSASHALIGCKTRADAWCTMPWCRTQSACAYERPAPPSYR